MKRLLIVLSAVTFFALTGCSGSKILPLDKYEKKISKYVDQISEAELEKQLYIIAGPIHLLKQPLKLQEPKF